MSLILKKKKKRVRVRGGRGCRVVWWALRAQWNDSRPCATVSGKPKMSHVIVAIQNTI